MHIFGAKVVKTRKPHRCHGCLRRFPAGSQLNRVTGTDGGQAWSTYWCSVCQTAVQEWGLHGDDAGEGEMKTGDPDAWEEVRQRVEGKQEGGQPATCAWTEDRDGAWETECGGILEFPDGGPDENEVRYCCRCGRPVEATGYAELLDGRKKGGGA